MRDNILCRFSVDCCIRTTWTTRWYRGTRVDVVDTKIYREKLGWRWYFQNSWTMLHACLLFWCGISDLFQQDGKRRDYLYRWDWQNFKKMGRAREGNVNGCGQFWHFLSSWFGRQAESSVARSIIFNCKHFVYSIKNFAKMHNYFSYCRISCTLNTTNKALKF